MCYSGWSGSSPCIVIMPEKHVCQTGNPIQITQSRGVLASLVAAETGCGSAHAPWHLRALPGQRINITLLDFSWAASVANDVFFLPAASGSGRASSSSSSSSEVAALREVKNVLHFAISYSSKNDERCRDQQFRDYGARQP